MHRPESGEGGTPRVRFLPPMAGGEKRTGWEALDAWVKDGEAAAPGGRTGWEALEKWVKPAAPAPETPASPPPTPPPAAPRPAAGGGLLSFLRRLFGGR